MLRNKTIVVRQKDVTRYVGGTDGCIVRRSECGWLPYICEDGIWIMPNPDLEDDDMVTNSISAIRAWIEELLGTKAIDNGKSWYVRVMLDLASETGVSGEVRRRINYDDAMIFDRLGRPTYDDEINLICVDTSSRMPSMAEFGLLFVQQGLVMSHDYRSKMLRQHTETGCERRDAILSLAQPFVKSNYAYIGLMFDKIYIDMDAWRTYAEEVDRDTGPKLYGSSLEGAILYILMGPAALDNDDTTYVYCDLSLEHPTYVVTQDYNDVSQAYHEPMYAFYRMY